MHAVDADEGSNGEVRYAISGPGDERFAIDAHTGWISTLVLLDRETVPTYTLTVVATDGGTPSTSNSVSVKVHLIDYNDNPPRFLQDTYTAAGIYANLPTLHQKIFLGELFRPYSLAIPNRS